MALTLASSVFAQTGTTFCAANVNSTGVPAALTGSFGSGVGSDLHLEVTGGVPNEFGFFLVGDEMTSGVVISEGLNCLIGTSTAQIYRYSVAGTDATSIGRFDNTGVLQNVVGTSISGTGFDVPITIPSNTPIPITSGNTWHFQAWYRDTPAASGRSNFSNGLSVTFNYTLQPLAGMELIPAGMFDMGSDAPNASPYFNTPDQQPVHAVSISQNFWMGAHEVTQAEYQALMGVNPSYFSGPNLPVEMVSWNDARAYCAVLTTRERALGNLRPGLEYRLPTEAEWEYACRAGTTTEFNIGPDLLCIDAKFGRLYRGGPSCNSNSTVNVGSYPANGWSLYDMHGNVWEWCLDSFENYSAASMTDPLVTGGVSRIIRGGHRGSYSYHCRSAMRWHTNPIFLNFGIGFRIVLAQALAP
ncbi:MAG: formylglycine-generating enzyme family protein [Planctomycetes bacterium]|nr:formylglycine-generating enzyme family protein [Planctomycetota bacterium]